MLYSYREEPAEERHPSGTDAARRPPWSCSCVTGRPRPPASRCRDGRPGCTWRIGDERRRATWPDASRGSRGWPRSTPLRSSERTRRPRPSRPPAGPGHGRARAPRVRLRRVDGSPAEGPPPPAGVEGDPALPERLPLPRRRVARRDADADHRRARTPGRGPSGPDRGGGLPCRSHQGGGGARPRHPPRPLPADRGLHGLGLGHRLRPGRPDRPGRQRQGRRPAPLAGGEAP